MNCGDKKCKVKQNHYNHMDCITINSPKVTHGPHVWDAEYVCYGPYLCPGVTFNGKGERV